MPTPMTLAMAEDQEQAMSKLKYKIGFVDGIIVSSVTYIAITLIALFIWSYQ